MATIEYNGELVQARTIELHEVDICHGWLVNLEVDLAAPDPDEGRYKEAIAFIRIFNMQTGHGYGESTFNRILAMDGELERIELMIYERIDRLDYVELQDEPTLH